MTTNTDIERIMNSVRVHLPGVLDDLLRLELFNVLDEFFRSTNVWREEITQRVTPGEREYELDLESSATIVRLLDVRSSTGTYIPATLEEPDVLLLRDEPSVAEDLTVTVALTVRTLTSEGYPIAPAWILKKHRDTFFEGLLGRMMAQPAKPYSSEKLAIFHTRRFRNGMAAARVEGARKNLYGGQVWRFPQSFATGRG